MTIKTNIKVIGFFQIIQSFFVVLLFNILAAGIFPPETVSGEIIPDISYVLSSQIFGFLFTGISLAILFRVDKLAEYISFELNYKNLLITFFAFIVAMISLNLTEQIQKLIVPSYLISSYLYYQSELMNSYNSLSSLFGNIHPYMIYLIGALLPAICEEFFFRGYLLQLSMKYFSQFYSVIIVSFLFAFMHFQFIVFFPLFIFSIILSLLTLKTGKLVYSVILHFINNATTLFILSEL